MGKDHAILSCSEPPSLDYLRPSVFLFDWLKAFGDSTAWDAFLNPALFLTTKALISACNPPFKVQYDNGTTTLIPSISLTGLVLISLLLGTFIIALISMTAYATSTPVWTYQLDSFAMMRIGAAIGHAFPMGISYDPDWHTMLDECPGWIGDESPENPIGRLGLGAEARIEKDKVFDARFEFADESLRPGERADLMRKDFKSKSCLPAMKSKFQNSERLYAARNINKAIHLWHKRHRGPSMRGNSSRASVRRMPC